MGEQSTTAAFHAGFTAMFFAQVGVMTQVLGLQHVQTGVAMMQDRSGDVLCAVFGPAAGRTV